MGVHNQDLVLKGISPFVLAAESALEYGIEREDVTRVIEEVLSKYYEMVRPKSASEWLGLDLEENNKLTQAPPWGAVFPWRARTLTSYQQAYEKAAVKENKILGTKFDITKGWLFCGPVSYEKIKIEAMRLTYVLKNISRNGYKRWNSSEGDVRATALINEYDDWRWLITAGNHRASAASALGYTEIPIRVNLIINRRHVKYWPHVLSGLFSIDNALKVFDNYFEGLTPPVTSNWLTLKLSKQEIEC